MERNAMPRKPKGEKPMTGAERAKAHRARKTPLGPSAASLSAPWLPPILSPMVALLVAWEAADEATQYEFLDTVGHGFKPDPMETPVIRSKPSQRFTAPVGSLLKGAK